MSCKVYDFNNKVEGKAEKNKKHIDKRKLMIRIVAAFCTILIFGTFCISLFF